MKAYRGATVAAMWYKKALLYSQSVCNTVRIREHMPSPMRGQTWEYEVHKGRGKGCESANRRKIVGQIFWNECTDDQKVNTSISVTLHVSKPWNAECWPLVMMKQNSRLEHKMTGKFAKVRNLFGKEGERQIIIFPFLTDLAAADFEVTCSTQRLHFQPEFTENVLMNDRYCLGGILDLLSLRAFKSSLDFLKTTLDKCCACTLGKGQTQASNVVVRLLGVSYRDLQLSCAM